MLRALRAIQGRGRVHDPDWWFLSIILTLVMLGVVMVFSASTGIEPGSVGANTYLIRHLIFVGLGIAAMLVVMNIDYHFWRYFSLPALMGVIALLMAVLVAGTEVYGARRWFDLGFTQAQPSELAKPVLIIYLAGWMCTQGPRLQSLGYGLVQFGVVVGVIVGLVMAEPDMGTSMVLATIGIAMFIVAGARVIHAVSLLTAGGIMFLLLAISAEYRRERVLAFLDPENNTSDTGWHLLQARLALGDGGLFGVGLGSSRQKFTWLPAPHNDAIFAVIGEELGLIGAGLVLLLFGLLGYRGFKIASSAPDRFGMLVAVGGSTWVIFQAVFNIGGVTSVMPFTGITLPFVSYGGSSIVVTLAAMGLVLNVSRQTVPAVARGPARTAAESPVSDVLAGARLGQYAEPVVNVDGFQAVREREPTGPVYRDWPEW